MVAGVLDESTYIKLYRGNIIPLNACCEFFLYGILASSQSRVLCYSARTDMGPPRLLFVAYFFPRNRRTLT